MSGQHFLIVHPDPPSGFDVEHPGDCPMEWLYRGVVKAYTCDVDSLLSEGGVEEFFRRDDEPAREHDDRQVVSVGRHPIEAWWKRIDCPTYGSVEFDGGLCLTDGAS